MLHLWLESRIDILVKDNRIEVLENTTYDYENSFTKSVVVNNVQEVKSRVYEAEKRINYGNYLTEDEYNKSMDEFF